MLGVWTFRVLTTAVGPLGVLGVELQQHAIDPWALGYAAVMAAITAILHYGRAVADPNTPAVLGTPPAPTKP